MTTHASPIKRLAGLMLGWSLLTLTSPAAAGVGATHVAPASLARLTATDGTWTECLPSPVARSKHAAVYDSQHERMILFGGKCQDACCPNGPVPDDVWILALDSDTPVWTQVRPAGTSPGAGLGPAAIYDPLRDRMLVPGATGRVWSLTLGSAPQWSELTITGSGPSPTAPSAVYDPVRDQMVVVTGSGTWTLSLGTSPAWTKLTPGGKAPTGVMSAVYDPVRDHVVVLGDSARVLSLSGPPAWTALTNNRMPRGHTALYDPLRDAIVAHGGCVGSSCGTSETWALPLSGTPAWTLLSNTGPLAAYHSAIYDPPHDRMVVFGGYVYQFYTDWSLRGLWTLSLGGSMQWLDLTPPNPPRACGIPAVRDPVRQRLITYDDSVRVMSLAGLPDWGVIPAVGPAPAPRNGYALIYDPPRDRLLLFGGWVWDGIAQQPMTDLWSLSLASPEQWTAISPEGAPPAASGPAVYDPVRDRMLLFGSPGVWELGLSEPMSWNELNPSGTAPPADTGFSAVYDPVRDRVLVWGGGGAGGLTSDAWELVLAPTPAWSALAPSGTPPAPRANHVAIYDPHRDRMVISGGDTGGGTPAADTWALALTPQPGWLQLATDGVVNGGSSAIYDPGRDRLVTLGTCAEATTAGCPDPDPGLWSLWFNGLLDVSSPPPLTRLSLAQNRPNPAHGSVVIPFALSRSGMARLRVYDVTGRGVRTVFEGALAAGDHAVRWDGLRDDGTPARAGAYFYELSTTGERLTRHLVLLR